MDGTRRPEARPKIIADSAAGDDEAVGLVASQVQARTVVRRISVETRGGAHNHYGARIIDSEGSCSSRRASWPVPEVWVQMVRPEPEEHLVAREATQVMWCQVKQARPQ